MSEQRQVHTTSKAARPRPSVSPDLKFNPVQPTVIDTVSTPDRHMTAKLVDTFALTASNEEMLSPHHVY